MGRNLVFVKFSSSGRVTEVREGDVGSRLWALCYCFDPGSSSLSCRGVGGPSVLLVFLPLKAFHVGRLGYPFVGPLFRTADETSVYTPVHLPRPVLWEGKDDPRELGTRLTAH